MREAGALLAAPEPQDRRDALRALPAEPAASPDEVAALVFEALGDEDFGVRQEAVRLCGRWQQSEAVLSTLERALCDEESVPRRSAAMEALGKLGARAVPTLARLARDARVGVRRLAVDALGMTRAPAAFEALSARADDEAPAVRAASLEALSRLGDPRAPGRIEEVACRRDEPPSVVLAGLLCLDELGCRLAPARVRPHLADALTAAPALRLLGRAGDVGPLFDVLVRAKGTRRRAAAVGLTHALEADAPMARAALRAERLRLERPLLELCAGPDHAAASAAVFVAAEAELDEGLAWISLRSDRALLVNAAHRAATVIAARLGGDGIRRLALGVEDAEAREFLTDLAADLDVRPPAEPSREPSRATGHPVAFLPAVIDERPTLDAAGFATLAELLHREAGLSFESHAAYRLEARLAARLKATGRPSWGSYLELLQERSGEGRAELAAALERVTVHETYFFRETVQLESFTRELLPAMVAKRGVPLPGVARQAQGTFRVLSAGCSTGEEVWTLAILLQTSGFFSDELPFEVVGTDVAPSVIETARRGRYGRRGFRGDVSPGVLSRWFREEGKNHVVADSLRDRVRFVVGNLLHADDLMRLGRFDVIFCRNVLIYMSDEARAEVVGHFFDRLRPGGVLFLGHSESLLNVESGFRFLPLEKELAYVKPRAAPGAPRDR